MRKGKGEDATRGGDKGYSVVHSNGGVTVTVYVESSCSLIKSEAHTQKGKRRRWLKPNPPIKALTRRRVSCFDRRAELLAYSLRLRSSTSKESIQNSDFKPKYKWKWSLPLRKLHHAFSWVLRKDRRWSYEKIETQRTSRRHQWCYPRRMTCNKAKRRLSQMFKKLWRGCYRWKCNKLKLY